jgi:predicted nuclease of predicted toxin-antitoxin system
VFDSGLARFTPDEQIWEHAAANGFTIVTADSDFLSLAKSRGAPPKIVQLKNCNYPTPEVEAVLRRHALPHQGAGTLLTDHSRDSKHANRTATQVTSDAGPNPTGLGKGWRPVAGAQEPSPGGVSENEKAPVSD